MDLFVYLFICPSSSFFPSQANITDPRPDKHSFIIFLLFVHYFSIPFSTKMLMPSLHEVNAQMLSAGKADPRFQFTFLGGVLLLQRRGCCKQKMIPGFPLTKTHMSSLSDAIGTMLLVCVKLNSCSVLRHKQLYILSLYGSILNIIVRTIIG